MEISDCIWDEADFLYVQQELEDMDPSLVTTSLPSPGLAPFQWSASPLADEADNSDMTPQCMPVIDPNFVREHFIEDCLTDGVNDVIENGEDMLEGYLADQENCEQFSTLHILVCGFCHCVFHVLEEFKSHLLGCDGRCKNSEYSEYDSTTAVALVLWTNTVLRRVPPSLTELVGAVQISQRIQARWWRLSKRSRQVWEKAAEVLRELAKVGSLVFPMARDGRTRDQAQERLAEAEGREIRWPGPQDFVEADEIDMLGNIKEEQEISASYLHPAYREVQRESPPYREVHMESPVYSEVQRESPAYRDVQRESSPFSEVKRESPPYIDVQRESPPCREAQRESPPYREVQRESPSYRELQRESPPYREVQEMSLPCYREFQSKSPPNYKDLQRKSPPSYREVQVKSPSICRETQVKSLSIYREVQGHSPSIYREVQGHSPSIYREVQGQSPCGGLEDEERSVPIIQGSLSAQPGGRKRTQKRDRRGRWDFRVLKPSTELMYSCGPCGFRTDNPWKLERHRTTGKHRATLDGSDTNHWDRNPGSGTGHEGVEPRASRLNRRTRRREGRFVNSQELIVRTEGRMEEQSVSTQERSDSTQDSSASTQDRSASKQNMSASTQDRSASTRDGSASTQDSSASIQDSSASAQDSSASTQDRKASAQDRRASHQDSSVSTQVRSASYQDSSASTQDGSAIVVVPGQNVSMQNQNVSLRDQKDVTHDQNVSTHIHAGITQGLSTPSRAKRRSAIFASSKVLEWTSLLAGGRIH